MSISQAAVAKNPRDTQALHALAVAYALRANFGFFVRKTWMASLQALSISCSLALAQEAPPEPSWSY